MGEEDLELRRLQLRRLMKLATRAQVEKPPEPERKEPTPLDILRSKLGDRGEEVLQAALDQFPEETMKIVEHLANLIRSGKVEANIDGGMLYTLFRRLGLRVKVETSIKYVKHGEAKDISELFKRDE